MSIREKYKHLNEAEHVLARPGMYIGTVEPNEYTHWVFNKGKMEYRSLEYSYGFVQIFLEILMNAIDQSKRVKNLTEIRVNINVETGNISIYNNGDGIDVVMHPDEKVYVPEMLFSKFRSSTNYNDTEDRIVSGINGIGAKATVVFSKEFTVETVDTKRKKKFTQVYRNNLTEIEEAIIEKTSEKGYTRITYIPDFGRFKMDGFNKVCLCVMKKCLYDATALTGKGVSIWYNDKLIEAKNFEDYVKLYTGDSVSVVHERQVIKGAGDTSPFYEWEYIICQNTTDVDGFRQVSFVNGIPTYGGGTHVDYITGQICKGINKGGKLKDIDIRNNMMLFLICHVRNPSFDSQTKNKLTSPIKKFGCECAVSATFIKKVMKTGILEAAKSLAQFKEDKKLKKTDGAKKSDIGFIAKLVDASLAGGKRSSDCVLILTEGDSAKASVMSGIRIVGTQRYGVFPLKGKLVNVRERVASQVSSNEEIQNIKKILGLKQGEDYSNGKNGLRYGRVMIITDADVDGAHIKGLLINFFHWYWPSLLKRDDFITCMATPIIKASKKGGVLEFYSAREYEKWKSAENTESSKWTIKYYKGLGTSTKDEFQEYFKNPKVIDYEWDPDSDKNIKLAFDKTKANDRKVWLKDYNPDVVLDYALRGVSYSEFVHRELKHFSEADNIRSIPCMVDGLKPSQRKIIYAAFLKNLRNEYKVAQFSGYVAEKTCYHHGEVSLMQAIIGLAQGFVGSNNMPLLAAKGQFGTRLAGGKDNAAARYIFTHLREETFSIFHKDDFPLLRHMEDDGTVIEPVYYVPTIPLVLINGSRGIGTGYKYEIPNYNPRDVAKNLMRLMKGNKVESMDPWYAGFQGSIEKSEKGYITRGIWERTGHDELRITELPIGTWTTSYLEFLGGMIIEGRVKKEEEKTKGNKIIRKISSNCDDENVDITIEFTKSTKELFKTDADLEKVLKLVSHLDTNNMYLYNSEHIIKRYKGPEEILEEFYEIRLEEYQKRKKYLLRKLLEEIKKLGAKARFIKMVCEGELIIAKRPKKELVSELEELEFPKIDEKYDYLLGMALWTLTLEEVEKLENEVAKKKEEYKELKEKEETRLWRDDLKMLFK